MEGRTLNNDARTSSNDGVNRNDNGDRPKDTKRLVVQTYEQIIPQPKEISTVDIIA